VGFREGQVPGGKYFISVVKGSKVVKSGVVVVR
jgi:hypothetical protein